jgi:hypothetical protein
LPHLRKQRGGGIEIRLAWIGCVSPYGGVDDLSGFFHVHVESRFEAVSLLAHFAIAGMADGGGLEISGVVLF